jgi:hypothetical protein
MSDHAGSRSTESRRSAVFAIPGISSRSPTSQAGRIRLQRDPNIARRAVADDEFVSAARRAAAAGHEACDAIHAAVDLLDLLIQERQAGKSHRDIADDLIGHGARALRMASIDAFREFERAVASLRASLVRVLVDEYGLSFADVASRLTVSRQAVARLYKSGVDTPEV